MSKESKNYIHVKMDKRALKALERTARTLDQVARALKLNGERLLKILNGSLKAVE